MELTVFAASVGAAGGTAWIVTTIAATWWFNRRVRRLGCTSSHDLNTHQLLPVSRRAGGERARCQSPYPHPRRQRARQFLAKPRSL